MRKIILILILGTFIPGCSVTRNVSKVITESSKKYVSENVVESVKEQNITNDSFFIQKAEIEILTQNGKEKFLANIKFEKPDKFLISLKSRSGIEGTRIYISNDTVLVNDRINKKFYFATSFYIEKKYRFSLNCLPLIFGDMVIEKNCEDIVEKCSGNKLNINCMVKGVTFNYNIDCEKRKALLVNQMINFVQQGIRIKYESFLYVGNILIPKMVELEDSQYNTTIKIKILKVEFPWNGSIKFVPGKGYELIQLI